MDQRARMATLEDFKRDRLTLLVASDVAARGLDIPAVSHIFNFDVPTHSEDYIHRIGRTGRAGLSGTAITIATPIDRKYVAQIEKMTGKAIQLLAVEATAERAAAVYGHHRDKTAEGRPERRTRARRAADRGRHRRNGAAPRAEQDLQPAPETAPRHAEPAEALAERTEPNPGRGDGRAATAGASDRIATAGAECRTPASRKNGRRENTSRRDRGSGQAVVGLGDHVPSFLLRRTRTPTA